MKDRIRGILSLFAVVACLAFVGAAHANEGEGVAYGHLAMATVDEQHTFFRSEEPSQLQVQIAVENGGLIVSDGENDIGTAEPGSPFEVEGEYTQLIVRPADPQAATGEGVYRIAFDGATLPPVASLRVPEAIARVEPAVNTAQPLPDPDNPRFDLAPNQTHGLFASDGTECTEITICVDAGSGDLGVQVTYASGTPVPVIITGGNCTTFKCNITLINISAGNQTSTGGYTIN